MKSKTIYPPPDYDPVVQLLRHGGTEDEAAQLAEQIELDREEACVLVDEACERLQFARLLDLGSKAQSLGMGDFSASDDLIFEIRADLAAIRTGLEDLKRELLGNGQPGRIQRIESRLEPLERFSQQVGTGIRIAAWAIGLIAVGGGVWIAHLFKLFLL